MSTSAPDPTIRLVDLAVEWMLQYARESTVLGPGAHPEVGDRLGQVDGYLSSAAAALIWFGPEPGDRPDPWAEVGSLMARVEAEFPGRLLASPSDLDRFDAEPPGGLTWAVAGLRDVSTLLRSEADAIHLAGLIVRGVRAVRLAGMVDRPPSAEDDRGLVESERSVLAALSAIMGMAPAGRSGLMVDLAGLPPRAAGEAIAIIETTGISMVPIVSLGGSTAGTIAGLRPEEFDRLRSLGGLVGLGVGRAFHPDADALADAIESAAGQGGIEGIALGSGFLGIDATIDGLGTAPDLLGWLDGRFGAGMAGRLASGNARALIDRVVRGGRESPGAST